MPHPKIRVLDSISKPGNPAKANEDRLGYNDAAAFVIDGATGLGDRQYMAGAGSDAAWIAGHFADGFTRQVATSSHLPDIARELSQAARDRFLSEHPETPRYAWPLSAFAMLQAAEDGFHFHGLADCGVFLLHDDGRADFHIAIPGIYEGEQVQARRHIERNGGITPGGGAHANAETMTQLRAARERQNVPGGSLWSLGLVPEASEHIVSHKLELRAPARAVICSDGLSDLVVLYDAYDAGGLVAAATSRGLEPLVEELRRFEREIDPEGLRYPRFKQSDDTTALLVELTP